MSVIPASPTGPATVTVARNRPASTGSHAIVTVEPLNLAFTRWSDAAIRDAATSGTPSTRTSSACATEPSGTRPESTDAGSTRGRIAVSASEPTSETRRLSSSAKRRNASTAASASGRS